MNKFKAFCKPTLILAAYVPVFIIGLLIVLIGINKTIVESNKIIELEKKNSSMEVIEYYVHNRGSFYVLEHKETKKKFIGSFNGGMYPLN